MFGIVLDSDISEKVKDRARLRELIGVVGGLLIKRGVVNMIRREIRKAERKK